MKMWKWMGLIGALAVLIWLSVPAFRIWSDPRLRSHRHTLRSRDPSRQLVWNADDSPDSTQFAANIIAIDHRTPYWDRYRSLLLGHTSSSCAICEGRQTAWSKTRLDGGNREEAIRSDQVAESFSVIP